MNKTNVFLVAAIGLGLLCSAAILTMNNTAISAGNGGVVMSYGNPFVSMIVGALAVIGAIGVLAIYQKMNQNDNAHAERMAELRDNYPQQPYQMRPSYYVPDTIEPEYRLPDPGAERCYVVPGVWEYDTLPPPQVVEALSIHRQQQQQRQQPQSQPIACSQSESQGAIYVGQRRFPIAILPPDIQQGVMLPARDPRHQLYKEMAYEWINDRLINGPRQLGPGR